MEDTSKLKENLIKYNNLEVYFNSGVINQIYSSLISNFSDFYGLILGRYKVVNETKINDQESESNLIKLSLIVENVIFIFDKNYAYTKLDRLIEKLKIRYANSKILGILF